MNELLMRLCWDPQLCAAVLEDDMGDRALAVLTKVMAAAGTILPLIRDQVQLEFMNNATEKDAILRGNCVGTRIMSAYSNQVGMTWVSQSLSGTVKRLAKEQTAWILDVAKANGATQEDKMAQVLEGQGKLLAVATSFLKRLHKKMALTPIEVRCMAYFVWIHARTFCPERSTVLLGGFVFLRVLNPALVSPESVPKLVPAETTLPSSFKANAIALCRLLQNLSNQTLYKDAAMCGPLNDWLSANHGAMESLLLDLATDPEMAEGTRPFARFSRTPEERHRHLRDVLMAEEWDALHVGLLRCKTHVMVRSTLGPVLSASALSPSPFALSNVPSGVSGSPIGGASSSLPASPNRSRSGSRYRGDDEELAIYGDGKMRMRPVRRGSLSHVSLFANMSQPNLSSHLPPNSSSATAGSGSATSSSAPGASPAGVGSCDNSPGPVRLAQLPEDRSASLSNLPRLVVGSRSRARTHSNSGSPVTASPTAPSLGHAAPQMPQVAHLRGTESSPATPGATDEAGERAFFALLESLPLPPEIQLERFKQSLEMLKRPQLLAEGILSDSRRSSKSNHADLMVRLAVALLDPNYGLVVDSFAQPLLAEWMSRWLEIDQPKEVEQVLAVMVRTSVLLEKGSKVNRGYQLDVEKIRLLTGEASKK